MWKLKVKQRQRYLYYKIFSSALFQDPEGIFFIQTMYYTYMNFQKKTEYSRNFCRNYLPLLWLSNDLFIYSLKQSSCSHFFHQLHMTLFMFLWFHMVTYGWSVRTYYVVIQIRLVQWRSRGCRHPAIFYRAGEAGRGYRKIVIFGQRQ